MTARIFFSLSALAANLLAASGTPVSQPAHDSLPRLLAWVLPHAIASADQASVDPVAGDVALRATLSFNQFVPLWLVATFLAITVIVRRHQRVLLRC